MTEIEIAWALGAGGFVAGNVAGLMGIGGGTLMVPLLIAAGATPVQAVASSGLAILITSISGTVQNARMGVLDWRKIMALGMPSILTAQAGVLLASSMQPRHLVFAFVGLLLVNIPLMTWGNRLKKEAKESGASGSLVQKWGTGALAGFLAGLFGIGGGVIMVPLQILLMGEKIKAAIQTSLAVIVLTSAFATLGHGLKGNLLPMWALFLGLGGLVGAQISTRFLPKLSDRTVNRSFRLTLLILALWMSWKAFFGSF